MIRASLGFIMGGSVDPKDPELGYEGLFVPLDAGPDLDNLGQGPLYRWANYDEVASSNDPLFQDQTKAFTCTTDIDKLAEMPMFARDLYARGSNLIESSPSGGL